MTDPGYDMITPAIEGPRTPDDPRHSIWESWGKILFGRAVCVA